MASLRKRGKHWYFRYVDENGKQRELKGCPDKRETESMAAALEGNIAKIKAGVIDPKALAYKAHEARPLADHLTDFHAYLVAKGGTAKHASVSARRVARRKPSGFRLRDQIGKSASSQAKSSLLIAAGWARVSVWNMW